MKKPQCILIIFLALFSHQSISQITQVEFAPSIIRTDFTYLSIQPLDKYSLLSLSTLAFFQKFYQSENTPFDEVGVQTTVYWNFSKFISIGPALYFNSAIGFSEKITLLVTKKTGKLTFAIIPSIVYLNNKNAITGELFAQIQFMQPFKKEWSFLAYTNFFTNWGGINNHLRSYQYLRIGLSKNNNQFGLAINLDVYGNAPIYKSSIGLFFRKVFLPKLSTSHLH